jgi:hypothetical protein
MLPTSVSETEKESVVGKMTEAMGKEKAFWEGVAEGILELNAAAAAARREAA